jgi:protein SCO1/2
MTRLDCSAAPLRRRTVLQLAALPALMSVAAALSLGPAAADPAADGGWGATLVTATGTPLGGEMLKGKPYAVYFGYMSCPDVCPTTLADLTLLFSQLDASSFRDAAHDFRVYFVSLDPERDNPGQLQSYLADNFDRRIIGLTGSAEAIATVARTFRAVFKRTGDGQSYALTHTASTFLVDRNGRLASKMPHGGPLDRKFEQVTALLAN